MDEQKQKLSWADGGLMIGTAGFFDLIIGAIGLLNFTVIGFIVVVIIAWIPSLFALLTFSVWLALKGEATLKRVILLIAPFTSGCVGIPGWTATIWPLCAKIIAVKTLAKVSPTLANAEGTAIAGAGDKSKPALKPPMPQPPTPAKPAVVPTSPTPNQTPSSPRG